MCVSTPVSSLEKPLTHNQDDFDVNLFIFDHFRLAKQTDRSFKGTFFHDFLLDYIHRRYLSM